MASNPIDKCCTETVTQAGATTGEHTDIYGLKCYVTGVKSKKVIVIFTDIFGFEYVNNMKIADRFAQAGYYTLMPDLFNGEPVSPTTDRDAWRTRHKHEDIKEFCEAFLEELKKDTGYEFLGVVGHCFGAKMVITELAEGKYASCGAVAHPSSVTIDEVSAIAKPLLISAAETDHVFPEDLRHQTEQKLKELGVPYQIDIFSGTTHGYAVRGDETVAAIKYAKEKTYLDQVFWFNRFSS